jgi:nitroreductase
MGKFESVHLTVINNPALLKKIRFGFGPDRDILYGAPTLILVSAQKPAPGYENVTYSNAAGIVENMALAATDLGVGACHIWGAVMALSKNADLVASLKLPEGFIPVCGLIVGKTEESYAERDIDTSRIGVTTID